MVAQITLPWPDRRLSPNARLNWRVKAQAIRQASSIGMILARDADLSLPVTGDLILRLKLYPPDKKRRDIDNVLASLKAYLDGIFRAAGADDSQVRQVVITWGERLWEAESCVQVEIEEEHERID